MSHTKVNAYVVKLTSYTLSSATNELPPSSDKYNLPPSWNKFTWAFGSISDNTWLTSSAPSGYEYCFSIESPVEDPFELITVIILLSNVYIKHLEKKSNGNTKATSLETIRSSVIFKETKSVVCELNDTVVSKKLFATGAKCTQRIALPPGVPPSASSLNTIVLFLVSTFSTTEGIHSTISVYSLPFHNLVLVWAFA